MQRTYLWGNWSPPRLIVATYAVVIAVGTCLLLLPWASAGESLSFLDALFTSTSATCVTGLAVVDTGVDLSTTGQLIVLALIQIGGLGVMTFSTLALVLMGKRLRLHDRVVVSTVIYREGASDLGAVVRAIVLGTLAFEVLGAVVLAWRWPAASFSGSLFAGIFHSISAFCNAGFGLFSNSLEGFRGDIVVNVTIMVLVIVGGLGFPVVLELTEYVRPRAKRQRRLVSLHTKVVLSVTALLILVGSVAIFALEYRHALADLTLSESITASVFQAITPRTAGFSTLPTGGLLSSTLFIMVMLMFVGGSPGSTAGGIKTTTLGMMLGYFYSRLHGDESVNVFRRTVPAIDLRRAVMVAGTALLVLFFGLLALLLAEGAVPPEEIETGLGTAESRFAPQGTLFLELLFESTSALGTVGLTTGVTSSLSTAGRLIIMVLMFVGRTGPLTLVVALGERRARAFYSYPEDHVLVG